MTLRQLQAEARARGFSVKKEDGEYKIYPKGLPDDDSVYFTDDIDDAYHTMLDMAKRLRPAFVGAEPRVFSPDSFEALTMDLW